MPPASSDTYAKSSAEAAPKTTSPANGEEADSQPINFNTFIPSHDPSLELPQMPTVPDLGSASYQIPGPPETMVSQDEAFTRALGAMYWGGYWTAVYHVSPVIITVRSRPKLMTHEVSAPHGITAPFVS